MAVIRISKTKGFTVMSNYHLRDKNLSLKAKGFAGNPFLLSPTICLNSGVLTFFAFIPMPKCWLLPKKILNRPIVKNSVPALLLAIMTAL